MLNIAGSASRRSFVANASTAVIGIGTAGCISNPAGDETQTWQYATPVPEETAIGRFIKGFGDKVNEQTDEINIKYSWGGELGGPVEIIRSVSDGAIQLTTLPVIPLYEDASAFLFPYIYEDFNHMYRATDPEKSPLMEELQENTVEEANVRPITYFALGTRHLQARKEVKSPPDLEGTRMRMAGYNIFQETAKGMGAEPVVMPPSESITSLSNGSVQAADYTPSNAVAFKIWEVTDYFIRTQHMRHPLPLVINEDSFQNISADARDIVRSSAKEQRTESLSDILIDERESLSTCEKNGMTVIDEANGLDLSSFQSSVSDHLEEAVPEWYEMAQRLKDV